MAPASPAWITRRWCAGSSNWQRLSCHSMWNKPACPVQCDPADLLILVGWRLARGCGGLAGEGAFLREVVFAQSCRTFSRDRNGSRCSPRRLRGNFFSPIWRCGAGPLESCPWMRRADVRRIWPARLEVRVEEHRPAARWEVRGAGRTGQYLRRGVRRQSVARRGGSVAGAAWSVRDRARSAKRYGSS